MHNFQYVYELTENLGKPVRLFHMSKNELQTDKDKVMPYIEKSLIEYFLTYEQLFSIYYFLKKILSYVANLSDDAQKHFAKINEEYKADFERVEVIETKFKDMLGNLRGY